MYSVAKFFCVFLAFAFVACRSAEHKGSDVKGVNLAVEHGERTVYKISRKIGKQTYYCSGTAFSKRSMITAAHCVYDVANGQLATPNEMLVYLDQNRKKRTNAAARIFPHVKFIKTDAAGAFIGFRTEKDLAIIDFGADIFPEYSSISLNPDQATKVKVVGFGVRGLYDQSTINHIFDLAVPTGELNVKRESEANQLALRYKAIKSSSTVSDKNSPLAVLAAIGAAELAGMPETSRKQVTSLKSISSTYARLEETLGGDEFVKRSGTNSLTTIADNYLLIQANIPYSTLSGLDKYLYDVTGLYIAPEHSTELADAGVSYGDSGGALFNSEAALIGVTTYINVDASTNILKSFFVNLSKQGDFFAKAKIANFEVPSTGGATTGPPPAVETNVSREVSEAKDLFAALASKQDFVGGSHYVVLSAPATATRAWLCKTADLQACGKKTVAKIELRPMTNFGKPGRKHFRTVRALEVWQDVQTQIPFSVVYQKSDGALSGLILEAIKK